MGWPKPKTTQEGEHLSSSPDTCRDGDRGAHPARKGQSGYSNPGPPRNHTTSGRGKSLFSSKLTLHPAPHPARVPLPVVWRPVLAAGRAVCGLCRCQAGQGKRAAGQARPHPRDREGAGHELPWAAPRTTRSPVHPGGIPSAGAIGPRPSCLT